MSSFGSVVLTFSWFLESDVDAGEYLALDFWDGTSWSEITRIEGQVDPFNAWLHERIQVAPEYLHGDFKLRFRGTTSSSSEIISLDDLKLRAGPTNHFIPATLFADSFEDDPQPVSWAWPGTPGEWNGKWLEDSQNDFFVSTQRATDGSKSAEVDGYTNNSTLTVGRPIDLSQFATADLSFDWYIESRFDSGEYVRLLFLDENGNWDTILSLDGNQDAENTWHNELVSISDTQYLHDEFRFRFIAKASRSNEDANIDNVLLVGTSLVTPPNVAPTSVDDSYGVNEDTTLVVSAGGGVLANDSDADGDPLSANLVAVPANGSVNLNSDGSFTYTPDADFFGTDSFTYAAHDNTQNGNTATVNITVNPVNDNPVAADDNANTPEDAAVVIDVLANDSDVDLDSLSVSGHSSTSNGTLVNHGDGTFTYTPNPNYNGPDSFTYTVDDGNGGSDTATVDLTVNPVNDTPTTSGISDVVVDEDSAPTNINLHAAFGDIEDLDSDLTYSISDNTNLGLFNGTPIVGGTLTLNYAADANGTADITVRATDTGGLYVETTFGVTINPVNDNPVAVDDNALTDENTALVIDVLGNDSDIDLDTLTVSGFTYAGSATLVNNGDGTFTYTPQSTGVDSFTYDISDGNGGSDSAIVNVTVTEVNDPPTTSGIADVVVDEDSPATDIDLFAAFDDPEDLDSQMIFSIQANTNSGLFSSTPIVGDTLTLNYAADANGTTDITVRATDTGGLYVETTFGVTVNPVNDDPVAADDDANTPEDTAVAIDVLANDDDVDLDSLTVSIKTPAANGELVVNGNGTITYTPDANYNGPDSFTYTVNDGNGGNDTAVVNITITPVNDNPVAADDDASTDENSAVVIDVLANDSDIDLDTLTVSGFTYNGNATLVNNGDGTFTYTPESTGLDSFTYTVSDGNGGSDTATVDIIVNAIATGPNLSHGEVNSVGSSWQTVTLAKSYNSMVVVLTPRYNTGSGPGVVRIDNVTSNSFDVRVDNVGSSPFSGGVHYVAVEEGVYNEPGYKLEAVKYSESQTSRKGSWDIDTVGYQQSYVKPVVVGQVMSANDSDWSVFWASSNSRTSPPSSSQLNVGKHIAEDPDTTRATETIGYLVIEATQNGTIEGLPFVADVGSDIVRGVDNGTYQYNYTAMPNAKTAILSSAGMDGGDGGWAVLRGNNPVPASAGTISLSIDEDQLGDTERKHTTEQVA